MTKENQIVMIDASKLQHHPQNPRKTITDLDELAASIKENGIMQNLTVVPVPDAEDSYYIVIGNRRFEAGKIAELKQYPCVISNMDYAKQLETMLIENMQRSDLTIVEQAEGFEQLTLNGFSVEDISAKTGFSQSTIRKRLKLCKYDKKNVADAQERGGRIEDFIKLEKIDKKGEREKLLKLIGTNDFNLQYQRSIKFQEAKKIALKVVPILKKSMEEVPPNASTWLNSWHRVYYCSDLANEFDQTKFEKSFSDTSKKYFYKLYLNESSQSLSVYYYEKEALGGNSKPQKSDAERQYDRAKRYVNKVAKEHYELRCNFMKNVVKLFNYKDYEKICIKHLCNMCDEYGYIYSNNNITRKYVEMGMVEKAPYNNSTEFIQHKTDYPAGHALGVVYAHYNDSAERTCIESRYYSKDSTFFREDERLTKIYEFLVELGYGMSKEEEQIINGTHPIYDLAKGFNFLEDKKLAQKNSKL